MLGRTSNQPGWLERYNLLVSCIIAHAIGVGHVSPVVTQYVIRPFAGIFAVWQSQQPASIHCKAGSSTLALYSTPELNTANADFQLLGFYADV